MHAAISYLMTAGLFTHAVLGCCWHQGPGCARCGEAWTKLSQHVTCCQHHHKERHQRPSPCNCRLECQGACQTLPPPKTQVAKVTLAAPFDTVATLPSISAVHLGPAGHWEQVAELAKTAQPLRAHLLHQILLI
jgi:hypothetical protein